MCSEELELMAKNRSTLTKQHLQGNQTFSESMFHSSTKESGKRKSDAYCSRSVSNENFIECIQSANNYLEI